MHRFGTKPGRLYVKCEQYFSLTSGIGRLAVDQLLLCLVLSHHIILL